MQSPFELLEVEDDATDEAIKKAYLRKVREYPPEQDPAAFQRIREAYEHVKTEKSRREYRLFHADIADISALLRQVLKPGHSGRPDSAALIGALTEGLLDHLADSAHGK